VIDGIPIPNKAIKGIPKTEIVWETYHTNGTTYFVTSKIERSQYFLYKLVDDKAEKLGKAANPVELKTKYLE